MKLAKKCSGKGTYIETLQMIKSHQRAPRLGQVAFISLHQTIKLVQFGEFGESDLETSHKQQVVKEV